MSLLLKKRVEISTFRKLVAALMIVVLISGIGLFVVAIGRTPNLLLVLVGLDLLLLIGILGLVYFFSHIWEKHSKKKVHISKFEHEAELVLLSIMGILGIVAGWFILFVNQLGFAEPAFALIPIKILVLIAYTALLFMCVKLWEIHMLQ